MKSIPNSKIQKFFYQKLLSNPEKMDIMPDLSNQELVCKDIIFLQKTLPYTDIIGINLSHNYIGDEGVKYLAQALVNSRVSILDLSCNIISNKGVKYLVGALPNTDIFSLDLKYNLIEDEGIEYMEQVLPRTCITSLDLSYNFTQDIEIKHIQQFSSNLNINFDELNPFQNTVSEYSSEIELIGNPELVE